MSKSSPRAPIYPFRDADNAVRIANDSPYGLPSSVFSENLNRTLSVAHRLEVGGMVIHRNVMIHREAYR